MKLNYQQMNVFPGYLTHFRKLSYQDSTRSSIAEDLRKTLDQTLYQMAEGKGHGFS